MIVKVMCFPIMNSVIVIIIVIFFFAVILMEKGVKK